MRQQAGWGHGIARSVGDFVKYLVLAMLLLVPAVGTADDRKRIALLDFSGPGSVGVRGEIMRLALSRCWVSSAANLDGLTISEFASDNEVDLVVEGSIAKRRRSYEIRVRFVSAAGKSVADTVIVARRPALDRVAITKVERLLVRALAVVPLHARP